MIFEFPEFSESSQFSVRVLIRTDSIFLLIGFSNMAESYVLDQALLSSDLAGVQVSVHEAIICPEFQRIFEFEKFNPMQSTCLNSVSTFIDPPSMN